MKPFPFITSSFTSTAQAQKVAGGTKKPKPFINMYKKLLLFIYSLSILSCTTNTTAADVSFNYDWSFRLGEMNDNFYDADHTDNSEWRSVQIPHDWSIELGYSQENTAGSNGFLPGGVGWYQKVISLSNKELSRNIAVRFEGVYNNSQVWINGHDLGNFPNGYLDFEYDLTPYLKSGDNLLTVRVDRRAYADARWYVGGGIYRPVHLIMRDKIYVPTHGVEIMASNVTEQNANVDAQIKITNKSNQEERFTLKHDLLFDGVSVANSSDEVVMQPSSQDVKFEKFTINTPKLWSIETPQRYELKTTILQGDKVVDQRSDYFGVKTAVFDPQKGFLLNGKETKIKGVNLHHDLGCLGVAVYDKALYRRLKKLQDLGVNAIRTSHNPHAESLLTMCDTMGLLVMNEFIDEWRTVKDKWIVQRSMSGIADSLQCGYPKHFDECAERDVKAFVRRDYNHPSIILWSIGNEIEWSYPYYYASLDNKSGYAGLVLKGDNSKREKEIAKKFKELSGGDDELARTAHELSSWIKDVDSLRPVTAGVAIPIVSRISGYVDALDVVGYNYKDADYETDHRLYGDKAIIGSENVAQYYEWKAVLDKPYISGIFLWTGIDYIGENGPWPSKGGLYSPFDFACFKTSRGEFFETLWNDAPKTHIVTTPASISEFKLQKDGSFKTEFKAGWLRKWLWFDTFDKWSYNDGEEVVVQVYTNAPVVELLLNGKSLGKKYRSDFGIENTGLWQVPYTDGELTAIGLDENGKEMSRYTLRTAGEIAQLSTDCDNNDIVSDGFDLAHIEIELQDEKGTLVCDDPREITITTDSKTKILGVDNGSDRFVGNHKCNKIITHNGRALVIIQPTIGANGQSEITLSIDGEIAKSITINYVN